MMEATQKARPPTQPNPAHGFTHRPVLMGNSYLVSTSIDKVQWRHKILYQYTPPCCRASYVWYLKQNILSKYSTSMSRCIDRSALLDSEHRLQILQQLWIALMSLTTRWPTKWSQQHWPYRVIADDVIVALFTSLADAHVISLYCIRACNLRRLM